MYKLRMFAVHSKAYGLLALRSAFTFAVFPGRIKDEKGTIVAGRSVTQAILCFSIQRYLALVVVLIMAVEAETAAPASS